MIATLLDGRRGWLALLRDRLSAALARHANAAEWLSFYRAWRRDPRAVGAMAPSSRALAHAITRHVRVGGHVLELGSGTGVFTRALVQRGVPQANLMLVERDPVLADNLRSQFPEALVLEGDVAIGRARSVWPDVYLQPESIICGLPLLNMGLRQQTRVMQGAFAALKPGGEMLLFTYGVRAPLRPAVLHRLRLRAVRVDTVLANMPPAHVWRISRRPSGTGERRP